MFLDLWALVDHVADYRRVHVRGYSLSWCSRPRLIGSCGSALLSHKDVSTSYSGLCHLVLGSEFAGFVSVSLRWWPYWVRAHVLYRCYHPLNGGIRSRVKGSSCCLSIQSRQCCVGDVVSVVIVSCVFTFCILVLWFDFISAIMFLVIILCTLA